MKDSHERLLSQLLRIFLKSQQTGVTRPLRIRLAIAQVQAVKAARSTVMGLMFFQIFKLLLFAGFAIFHVGLFFYLDVGESEKGEIFMILGGVYFLLMVLGMFMGLSQKRWMKMTGADKAVMKAIYK